MALHYGTTVQAVETKETFLLQYDILEFADFGRRHEIGPTRRSPGCQTAKKLPPCSRRFARRCYSAAS